MEYDFYITFLIPTIFGVILGYFGAPVIDRAIDKVRDLLNI